MTPEERAVELTAAHAKPEDVDEENSILNYAEAPREKGLDTAIRSGTARSTSSVAERSGAPTGATTRCCDQAHG